MGKLRGPPRRAVAGRSDRAHGQSLPAAPAAGDTAWI